MGRVGLGRVGSWHKILRLRWVGLGRVQCQKYLINIRLTRRLANSGFGHSGTPFPPLSSPPFPPLPFPPSLFSPPFFSLPFVLPFPRGAPPLNQLGGLGSAVSSSSEVWGEAPADKRCGAYLSQKEQLWWQQFLCVFIRINLNFCRNTRLLSSRYSVSLRAKHSVGSRGKASGQGVSRGTKSP